VVAKTLFELALFKPFEHFRAFAHVPSLPVFEPPESGCTAKNFWIQRGKRRIICIYTVNTVHREEFYERFI
jgi:hypothetical protein